MYDRRKHSKSVYRLDWLTRTYVGMYKVPVRDVVDLEDWGYRNLKRGKGTIIIRRPYLLRVLLLRYTVYTLLLYSIMIG